VDQGVELLTGKPAGERQADGSYPKDTLHAAAQARLQDLAEKLKESGETP
jgi:hypothetical protein